MATDTPFTQPVLPPPTSDPQLEAGLVAAIEPWLVHMAWRSDFAEWRERRIWQEKYQEGNLKDIREALGADVDGKVLLDLGAGMGGLSVALLREYAAQGLRLQATDFNPDYCHIARMRARRYGFDLPITVAAGEQLPYAGSLFDVVVCMDVLEHVRDAKAVLSEIYRVLKPGGVVLTTVPNRHAFRDPHYHLPLINWLPRAWAEKIVERAGRSKRGGPLQDRQELSELNTYSWGDFVKLASGVGFYVRDQVRHRIKRGEIRQLHGWRRRALGLLRRSGLLDPLYRLYRYGWQGTYQILLAKPGQVPSTEYRVPSSREAALLGTRYSVLGTRVALYNLTTTTRWGGVETFVWEVAIQLAERGYSVEIFGGRGGGERRRIPGVRVRLFPYIDRDTWRKLPLMSRQYGLTKLLERLSMAPFSVPALLLGRFDLVHIQKPYDLPVGVLSKLSGAKLLFGCHGKDFWPGDKLFARFADGSVAASCFNAEQVQAHYGIEPVVVYNGVDLRRFSPEGVGDEAVLQKYDLTSMRVPSTEYRVPSREETYSLGTRYSVLGTSASLLYAGRLVRWKGVEYLVQALAQVEPGNTVLWIAGEGEYRPTLERMALEAGVAHRVRFLGKLEQDELVALYRRCDVLVATSFVNETFGIALCEAMACGTPVVASDFGGFREVVVDGETGLLARPQDPADLAAKINILLADPELRARMGEAGRMRVVATFSWQAVADRLEEVYRCLVPSST